MKLLLTTAFACLAAASVAQNLPAYVPAKGLVGYYPLSKSQGLRDISGNGNHGVGHALHIKDSLTFQFKAATDRFGNEDGAMSFDASNENVTAESHFTVDVHQPQKFSQGFSIGGWRYSLPMEFSQSFFSKDHTAARCAFEILHSYRTSNFQFAVEGDTVVRFASPSDPLCFFGWHFVVGTFDSNSLRLYVDGDLAIEYFLGIDDLPPFQDHVDANGKFRIGHNVTPLVFNSTGAVDDVFIYNRDLTPTEIQGLFQAGGNVTRRADTGFDMGVITFGDNAGIYPAVTSPTKPKAAASINKAMQMIDFGKIRTPKKPGAIQPDKPGVTWSYTITWPTRRLLEVITRRETYNTESRGGETLDILSSPHYFDITSGDIIAMKSFFTPEGYARLAAKLKALNLDLSKTSLIVNPFGHQLSFSVSNMESYDRTVALPVAETNPLLSAKGIYYLNDGPVPPPETSPDHLWTGLIGTGIHATLLLRTDSPAALTGMEVYDNYGTVIPLKGEFQNGVLKLYEMDDKGNVGGSFEATLKDRKLSGKWINKDGTKTMPFSAVIAGE